MSKIKKYLNILDHEFYILIVVAMVQFVNILEFMIFMPLGPELGKAMNIPVSHIGYVGGSYTFSAAISGIICASFLDRFDRKKALLVTLLGLAVGTLLGPLSTSATSLFCARVVSGAFGGPATSLSFAIVGDIIPAERRGRGVSFLMMSFSAASIFGVPLGLELANIGGWRLPLFSLSALILLVLVAVYFYLPSLTLHLKSKEAKKVEKTLSRHKLWVHMDFLLSPIVFFTLFSVVLSMASTFMIVPNLAPFLQLNQHYPKEHLSTLYFSGGLASILAMRFFGMFVDRFGSWAISFFSATTLTIVLCLEFMTQTPLLTPVLFFVFYMLAQSMRGVALNTISTKVPKPHERAQFMSAQSASQHLAASLGAFLSSKILFDMPSGEVGGTYTMAKFSIAMIWLVPFCLLYVERNLKKRKSQDNSIYPNAESIA